MNKSKLIQFLSNFSKSELRQFKDFVHSPFFNKHKKTTELLDYILQSNNWQSNHLEMRKTYSVLFPNEKFDEQKLLGYWKQHFQMVKKNCSNKQLPLGKNNL